MKRYVISDIHGNNHAFQKLLDHVDPNPEELIILGDLGDRGFDTWGVFEECDMLLDEGAHIVSGNHDVWLLNTLTGKMDVQHFTNPTIGGATTLKSFELARERHGTQKVDLVIHRVLTDMVPFYEQDDYLFVHAGIDPRVPYIEDQKLETLVMGCDDWRNPKIEHPYDQMIVFGHVPTPRIHRGITEDDARIWSSYKAKKMCVDTGAGFGMRLTLADLYEGIAYAYDFTKNDIIEYRFKRKERY